MKKLMLGLMTAFAANVSMAETAQTVKGGYYYVEEVYIGRSVLRMSIDGLGKEWSTSLPKGDTGTFKATPDTGMKIADWGTCVGSVGGANIIMSYGKVAWTGKTSDDFVWAADASEGDGYLAVNFKYIIYNMKYDANGGADAPDVVNGKRYDEHFNLSSVTPTKQGFDFIGWKPDTKTDKIYSAGQEVSGTDLCSDDWHEDGKTVTMVAQWSQSAPPFTREQVERAGYEVKEAEVETTVSVKVVADPSVTLKLDEQTISEDEYAKACEFYGIKQQTKPEPPPVPTAEDFKAVSKDAQVVQEGEIAVKKESIQAAKAETVAVADGVVTLAVGVNSNADFTAETKDWKPVELTTDNVAVKDGKIVISIPVSDSSGFMILQSGDAKISPAN